MAQKRAGNATIFGRTAGFRGALHEKTLASKAKTRSPGFGFGHAAATAQIIAMPPLTWIVWPVT
jgi:hypothetical protein